MLGFGEAALEALHAIVNDPAKRGLASEKMLSMAKLKAMESMEVDFLVDNMRLAREAVEAGACRIAAVGLAVVRRAKEMGADLPGLTFDFEAHAAVEIERSEAFLTLT